MHHNLIIKNGDATQVEKEILVDGVQFIDKEPVEGSFNPVTSDGVAKSIGDVNESIGDVNEAIGDVNNELAYIKQLLTNPLNLPQNTIRCKFTSGYTPTMGTSQTLVDAGENVWDIGFSSAASLFRNNTYLLKVIGANTSSVVTMSDIFYGCTSLTSVALFDTSNVTNMFNAFRNCTSLTSVALFDTSNVTNMGSMFNGCTSLASVPLFDTSKVKDIGGMFRGCTSLTSVPLFDTSEATQMYDMFRDCTSLKSVPLFNTSKTRDVYEMFYGCVAVTGGALALYQQLSTQTTPPTNHTDTFKNCGSNTTTGAAELAQIPASWGGTGAG